MRTKRKCIKKTETFKQKHKTQKKLKLKKEKNFRLQNVF